MDYTQSSKHLIEAINKKVKSNCKDKSYLRQYKEICKDKNDLVKQTLTYLKEQRDKSMIPPSEMKGTQREINMLQQFLIVNKL